MFEPSHETEKERRIYERKLKAMGELSLLQKRIFVLTIPEIRLRLKQISDDL